jgi:hypothetical protein
MDDERGTLMDCVQAQSQVYGQRAEGTVRGQRVGAGTESHPPTLLRPTPS